MKIKITISNQYAYDVGFYPFGDGLYPDANSHCERISRLEGQGAFTVDSGECSILDIPGMGSLLVQFLGKQKLENCHDRFCENPSDFDQYEQMALLRYKTTEIYWRFPTADDAAEMELRINDVGTVCLDKVLSGEARRVSLPEFFIPPVSCRSLPEGTQEEGSQQK
ncbi:MAG: hypothetical protein P8104_05860 [Gammaproteobacteria bacterium]